MIWLCALWSEEKRREKEEEEEEEQESGLFISAPAKRENVFLYACVVR